MTRRLRLVLSSSSAVGLVLALSAGACGSTPEIDESTGRESLALRGDGGRDTSADAAACRDIVLRTRRDRHARRGEDGRSSARSDGDEDEVDLSPPMAFGLPNTVALTSPSSRTGVFVELSFQRPGAHEEIVCLYASRAGAGAAAPAAEATLLFCSDGTHGDQVVTASEAALGVVAAAQTTASVTLHEVAPCQRSDGGTTDAATPTDSSIPDAAIDSGPTCTPATCLPTSACMSAACTASGCQQSPLPLGTACNDGSLCTAGDVCDGAGLCSGFHPYNK